MFWNKYPYSDFSQINLDWIINKLCKLQKTVDSLDVKNLPEAIKTALQEMIDNGDFDALINNEFLQRLFGVLENTKTWMVDTFENIASLDDISAGDTVTTGGYYTIGDGGQAVYLINTVAGLPVGDLYALPFTGNVRAWGLTGSGEDETDALQMVINAINTVDLAGLEISVSKEMTMHSNMTIKDGTITIKNGVIIGNGVLNANSTTNFTVDNVTFNGGTQTDDFYMITAVNAEKFILRNSTFNGGLGYRVRVSASTGTHISNCSCNNVTGIQGNPGGFVYMQGGKNAKFENIRASNLMDHVIYIDGSVAVQNATIDTVNAESIGVSALTSGAVVAVYGNVTSFQINNVNASDAKSGISVLERNSLFPKNGKIINCVLNTTLNGVEIIGNASTVDNVSNIVVAGCTVASTSQDGYSIRFTRNVNVNNCICVTAARYGFDFTAQRYSTINNCIVNYSASTGFFNGARDTATSTTHADYNVISNNVCMSAVTCFASTTWATNTYFINNTAFEATNTKYSIPAGTAIGEINRNDTEKRSVTFGTSAPTSGYHVAGDIIIDTTGSSNGWRCTASGTPGTWIAK